jgi:hypothetical protein
MALRTIDLVYLGVEYRIQETAREAGASIRPAEGRPGCLICPRTFRAATKCVCLPDGDGPLCLPCAIRVGALVPQPPREDDEAARRREAMSVP